MSVSIGSLRYDIIADTAGFQKGMVGTQREISAAKRVFMETRTPVENLAIEMEGLNRVFRKGGIDQATYSRAAKQLKLQSDVAAGGVRGMIASIKTAPAALTSAAKAFVAYRAASAIGGTVKKAFGLAMEIESTTSQFAVLTGSAERAAGLVSQLRQYDLQTTFSFSDTTAAAQKLLNFGVQVQDVIPNLKALGDISGGNSDKLSRLALAFGQTTAMGKLMGGEVRQMVEAGFNPLQEISRMTGESMSDLQDRMKDGGISANELALAIQSATSEGGRFYGMVDERAKTMAGQLDLLNGKWEMLLATAGEYWMGEAGWLTRGANAALDAPEWMAKNDPTFDHRERERKQGFWTGVAKKTAFTAIAGVIPGVGMVTKAATMPAKIGESPAAREKRLKEESAAAKATLTRDQLQGTADAIAERNRIAAEKAAAEQNAKDLEDAKDKQESRKDAADKARAARKKKRSDKLRSEEEAAAKEDAAAAARIRESTMTEKEKLDRELADIDRLERVGAIDATTAGRARGKLQDDFGDKNQPDKPVVAEMAPSVTRDSKEEYAAMWELANEDRAIAERQHAEYMAATNEQTMELRAVNANISKLEPAESV
ncbi:MAG TPA: tape measure protein [Pirellulales bacterium]|nr:tape measure protein [Pirellulales bacterium]